MKFRLGFLGIVLQLVPVTLFAASNTISALQSPVWLQRDGAIRALKAGDEVIAGDKIRTGVDARVLIRLAEGSDVKLGGNTRWTLDTQSTSTSDGVFNALMSVAKGAFRFTTTALSKSRKRNISARLNTATIGIRGTDVWGQVDETRTFVVLIEGKIEIERNGQTTAMSNPLSLYSAPNNAPVEPLSTVDLNALATYAQQTELQTHQGVQSVDGTWRVNVSSYRNRENAQQLKNQLDNDGYPVFLQDVTLNNQNYTRVVMSGFRSRNDAQFMQLALSAAYGLTPWISSEQ